MNTGASDHDALICDVQSAASTLAKRLENKLGVARLAQISQGIQRIQERVNEVDLFDLRPVPYLALKKFACAIQGIVSLFDDYIQRAADLERKGIPDIDRHGPHKLTDDNTAKWWTEVSVAENEIFNVTTPILLNQTRRKLQASWGAGGLAIKSTIRKLKDAGWRIPFSVSGIEGTEAAFWGIQMRKVNYVTFTEKDQITCLEDCYVPFLKRNAFQAEQELRLLGVSNVPLKERGIALPCKLEALIEEIIVGPKASADKVRTDLLKRAKFLSQVLIHPSILGPCPSST